MKENRSFGNMKRINLYPYILSASLLVSCSEELLLMNNDVSETLVLEAVTEGSSASRTYLSEIASGTYQAFWSVDDCIGLYADGEESPYPFHLISGEGTSVAQFKGPNRGSHYIAVYPWSIAGKAEGETISVTIPEEQEFVQGSFSSNSYPMVANGDVSGLSFKNLCSILKLSITGKQAVTAIEFLPADSDTFVSGPATVLLSNHDAPRLEMSKEGGRRIILNTPDVLLNEKQATDFYLILPAQTYPGGFTVRVHTLTGSMDKKYESDFTMERSAIHISSPFALKLDKGVEPSDYLEGKGTRQDPFLINTLGDLALMQMAVNNGGAVLTSEGVEVQAYYAHYKMTSDIDLSPVCGAEMNKSWIPIEEFLGSFDGGGHKVSNLYIECGDLDNQGFFYIAHEVSNLWVQGYVHGSSRVGLVAAYAAELRNCVSEGECIAGESYFDGYISDVGGVAGFGHHMEGCVNYATVRIKPGGKASNIGGIVGRTIFCTNCKNEGAIIASRDSDRTGGIAGDIGVISGGTIMNCSNFGIIQGGQLNGGILGSSSPNSIIVNCINRGVVFSDVGHCGGILGRGLDGCLIANCVSTQNAMSGPSYSSYGGAICGYIKNGGILENCYWPQSYPAVSEAGNQGAVVSGIGFNSEQLAGAEFDSILYLTKEGYGCTTLLEALNAWAYENSTEDRVYNGWEIKPGESCPSLIGEN